MDAQARLQQLRALAQTVPNFDMMTALDTDAHVWLGRLHAILQVDGDFLGAGVINAQIPYFGTSATYKATAAILAVMYQGIAKAELQAPAGAQSAFLGVGNSFDALSAVGKVLAGAANTVMLVDPYMDETALSRFALLAPEAVKLSLLSDQASVKANLRPTAEAWIQQYGETRPLSVRVSPPRLLHDRLIIVDERDAWVVSQSFAHLAARSPASLMQSDPETASLKVAAYRELWNSAAPV